MTDPKQGDSTLTALDSDVAHLKDTAQVIELMHEFAHRVDSKDWAGYAALYAPDGELVVPWRDPIGQPEIARMAEANLGRYRRTHHCLTNHRVTLDVDTAHCTSYITATHLLQGDSESDAWVLGGIYDVDLRRVDGQWRFTQLQLTYVWERGERPLMAEPAS